MRGTSWSPMGIRGSLIESHYTRFSPLIEKVKNYHQRDSSKIVPAQIFFKSLPFLFSPVVMVAL